LRPRGHYHFEIFLHERADILGRNLKDVENPRVRMASADGEIHSAMREKVQHGRLLGQVQRMVNGNQVDGYAQPESLGALGNGAEHGIGGGEQREFRLEVNLGDPEAVEAQLISQSRLLQELIQALERDGARRALHLSKQTELHADLR